MILDIIASLLISLFSMLLDAGVFVVLWNWFVPTALPLPALSYKAGLGLTMVLSFIQIDTLIEVTIPEDSNSLTENRLLVLVKKLSIYTLILIVGYVVHIL